MLTEINKNNSIKLTMRQHVYIYVYWELNEKKRTSAICKCDSVISQNHVS